MCIRDSGITGPTIQAFNFADAAHNAFNLNPWIGGALMAACVAVVAFGGAKRLGRVSELVVPVMAIIYIILALVILGINFKQIPSMFGLIFSSAFKMNSVYGAIWGSTVTVSYTHLDVYKRQAWVPCVPLFPQRSPYRTANSMGKKWTASDSAR